MACPNIMRRDAQEKSQVTYLGKVFLARIDRALNIKERAVVLLRLDEYPIKVILR